MELITSLHFKNWPIFCCFDDDDDDDFFLFAWFLFVCLFSKKTPFCIMAAYFAKKFRYCDK